MAFLNEELLNFATEHAKSSGHPNVLFGFADITDNSGKPYANFPYKTAISVAVALDPKVISEIKDGITQAFFDEHAECEQFLNHLIDIICEWLQEGGYEAISLERFYEQNSVKGQECELDKMGAAAADLDESIEFDGTTAQNLMFGMSHRMIAAQGGLGWIGKSGLVVTKVYGTAILLGSILTDAEFECSQKVFLSRCRRCLECILACPASTLENVDNSDGTYDFRNIVGQEACREVSREWSRDNLDFEAEICGLCIYSCPYTKSFLRRHGYDYA